MSYSGTVTCGHCWQTGHNKRSCPKLKKYIDENPDTYTARAEKIRKESESPRRCSYCAKRGHNRATCPLLLKDVDNWQASNIKWVQRLVEVLEEEGVGLGALITHSGANWSYREDVLMVVGLHPAHQDDASLLLKVSPITNPSCQFWVSIPDQISEKLDGVRTYQPDVCRKSWDDYKTIATTTHSLLDTLGDKEEWLAGGDIKKVKKVIFKDRTHDDFWQNKHGD